MVASRVDKKVEHVTFFKIKKLLLFLPFIPYTDTNQYCIWRADNTLVIEHEYNALLGT